MPLSAYDRVFLKQVFANLKPDALKPGDSRYENVYDRPGCEDPIGMILNQIELSLGESTVFFSGFRGSGKTTELFRLQKELQDLGYVVLYADALDYINPSLPIEISDLLIVLAGAFGEALAGHAVPINTTTYWGRFWKWLRTTNVELKEIKLKAGLPDDAAGAELKLELKNTPDFRQRLAEALKDRIGLLRNDVVAFFEDGYKAIYAAIPATQGVVFLFDSLEQIQGSLSDSTNVVKSVELLFSNNLALLSIPYLHMVYTVPPWLKFVLKGVDMAVIPCIRIWNNDGYRSSCEPGYDALRRLVAKRFPSGGVERLLGPQHSARLNRLIGLSGGHFRDLLLLIRQVVLLCKDLPATESDVEHAITEIRAHFLPIPVEDALRLHAIAADRKTPLQNDTPEEVTRLTKFLNSHIVLYLRNGEEWYDVHPLVRGEVESIVKADAAAGL
jgi:hypothetical protein